MSTGKRSDWKGKEEYSFLSAVAKYALYGIFIVIPAYLENNYFNLLQAKTHVFILVALLIIGLALFGILSDGKRLLARIKASEAKAEDLMILGYILIAWISAFTSGDVRQSVFGLTTWGMGAFELTLGALVFFLFKYNEVSITEMDLRIIGTANFLLLTLAAVHFSGVDLFHMHANVNPAVFYDYASTLGQKNMISAYLCLMTPVVLFMFTKTQKRIQFAAMCLLTAVCFFDVILCSSDSVYLGLMFAAFVMVPYFLSSVSRVRQLSILMLLFGGVILVIWALPMFGSAAAYREGLYDMIVHPIVGGMIAGCGLVLMYSCCLLDKKRKEISKNLQKIVILLTRIGIISVLIGVVVFSVITFSDDFGSRRGLIWRYGWNCFKNFNFRQFWIGAGPEMTARLFRELSAVYGMNVFAAHSVPLQVLLTTGVLGLGAYIGCLVIQLRRFSGNGDSERICVLIASLAAFWGQSLISSTMIMNFAIVCCFAGMLSNVFIKRKERL